MTPLISALIRGLRIAVCCGVAAAGYMVVGSPYAVALVPMLAGTGKYLRDKWGLAWLPF